MQDNEGLRVSVIIPVYNVKDYLSACVNSVLSQTHTNLDIWLIDDGSTDGSGDICERFRTKDNRIHVIHQKNMGQSCARNAALERVNGDYLTFVDADDRICENMIEHLLTEITEHDADAAVCQITEYRAVNESSMAKRLIYTDNEVYEALFDKKYGDMMRAACGKLYKKQIFEGIRFPEGRIHEDEFTIHRILGACSRLVITDEGLYYRNVRSGSTTRQAYSLKALDAVEALEDRCRYFEGLGNGRFTVMAYKDYLKKSQFHFYSLKKYYPNEKEKTKFILQRYKEYYDKIFSDMNIYERLRYGLFIYFPSFNRLLKSIAGARKI